MFVYEIERETEKERRFENENYMYSHIGDENEKVIVCMCMLPVVVHFSLFPIQRGERHTIYMKMQSIPNIFQYETKTIIIIYPTSCPQLKIFDKDKHQ